MAGASCSRLASGTLALLEAATENGMLINCLIGKSYAKKSMLKVSNTKAPRRLE
jgi:hypothetical protein